jgi:hypothetical protein
MVGEGKQLERSISDAANDIIEEGGHGRSDTTIKGS